MLGRLLTKLSSTRRRVLDGARARSRRAQLVLYPDDAFLVSYPRSGMAWLMRLIASMRDPKSHVDVKNIRDYVPYVYSREVKLAKRPRIIKSHELYQAKYPKVIYLLRDGRDVAVSYYNYYKTLKGYSGSFRQFLSRFLRGNVDFGSWQDHVRSWLFCQHASQFMIVRYEQIYEAPYKILYQVADFLNLDVDDDGIRKGLQKYTFGRHQNDIRRNSVLYETGYRGGVRGSPGAWKEAFTEDLLNLFWTQAGEPMEKLGYTKHGGWKFE